MKAALCRCRPTATKTCVRCLAAFPRPLCFGALSANAPAQPEEYFFCCTWAFHETTGAALLLFAGQKGVIRILDANAQALCQVRCRHGARARSPQSEAAALDALTARGAQSLPGHGSAINDLKVHPEHQSLLLSASRDLSIRLWNMHSGVLIIIFAGEGGHRNEVLTCDWQRGARCTLASAGMDCVIKVWTATDADWAAVEEGLKPWDPAKPLGTFRTRFVQLPEFSTYRVHANYVDCVRFFGPRGALLTKSVDSHVTLWQPEEGPYAADGQVRTLATAELVDADLWFLRFALCARSRVLACGNRCGVVRVWDMHQQQPLMLAQLHARAPAAGKAKAAAPRVNQALPVRQAMPSADGRIVIACCEDGTIWRWDRRPA